MVLMAAILLAPSITASGSMPETKKYCAYFGYSQYQFMLRCTEDESKLSFILVDRDAEYEKEQMEEACLSVQDTLKKAFQKGIFPLAKDGEVRDDTRIYVAANSHSSSKYYINMSGENFILELRFLKDHEIEALNGGNIIDYKAPKSGEFLRDCSDKKLNEKRKELKQDLYSIKFNGREVDAICYFGSAGMTAQFIYDDMYIKLTMFAFGLDDSDPGPSHEDFFEEISKYSLGGELPSEDPVEFSVASCRMYYSYKEKYEEWYEPASALDLSYDETLRLSDIIASCEWSEDTALPEYEFTFNIRTEELEFDIVCSDEYGLMVDKTNGRYAYLSKDSSDEIYGLITKSEIIFPRTA